MKELSSEELSSVRQCCYYLNKGMKRLFQFGAILMLIGAFYPLLELFDRWDAPGLANDTEFKVYASFRSLPRYPIM